jgi:hypothetical protein
MQLKQYFHLLLAAFAAAYSSACDDSTQNHEQDAGIEIKHARRADGDRDVTSDGDGADAFVDAAEFDTEAAPDEDDATRPVHEPVIGCAPADLPATASFEILPPAAAADASASDSDSVAYGVSANGAAVFGVTWFGPTGGRVRHPTLWKDGQAIDLFEPGSSSGLADAANCDGSVVLATIESPYETYRWSTSTGLMPFPGARPRASKLSADGRIAVGAVDGPDGGPNFYLGARWVGQDLTIIPQEIQMIGLSADGNVAIGSLRDGQVYVFRWTPASGVTVLFQGDLPRDLSADGSTILLPNGRWTDALGLQPIPCTRPCGSVALSATGKIVAIHGTGHENMEVWDVKHGTRRLAALLAEHGASFGDWQMGRLNGMSNDGRVFVGGAVNSAGTARAFRAILPPSAYE